MGDRVRLYWRGPFPRISKGTRAITPPPWLIYDWIFTTIESNTSPYIKVDAGYMVRDPATFSWRELSG